MPPFDKIGVAATKPKPRATDWQDMLRAAEAWVAST